MRLSPSAATFFAGVALAATFGLAACTKNSGAAAGDDAGDASGDDTGVAIDSSLGSGDAALTDDVIVDEVPVGNCVVPDGTYAVTATVSGDAGFPSCTGSTTTVTFPLPSNPDDAGLSCIITPDGMLPVCTVDFSCTQGGGAMINRTVGYVQVFNSSYAGFETVQLIDATSMQLQSSCSYNLSYVKQ